MKKVLSLILLIFSLFRCSEHSKNDPCQIYDSRIIGKWKLIEKCKPVGIKTIWEKTTEYRVYTFTSKCEASEEGTSSTSCNQGNFTITNSTLDISWNCGGLVFGTNIFTYEFNLKGDTLIFRVEVDENSCGLKFVKQ